MKRLHLLTVADIDDPTIGLGCAVDQDNVHRFMTDAAADLNIPVMSTSRLRQNTFRLETITDAVNSLDCTPEDGVVFYYSGHGFRSESKESIWPAMALGHTPYGQIKGLDIDWVYSALHDKSPRFLMVIVAAPRHSPMLKPRSTE